MPSDLRKVEFSYFDLLAFRVAIVEHSRQRVKQLDGISMIDGHVKL